MTNDGIYDGASKEAFLELQAQMRLNSMLKEEVELLSRAYLRHSSGMNTQETPELLVAITDTRLELSSLSKSLSERYRHLSVYYDAIKKADNTDFAHVLALAAPER